MNKIGRHAVMGAVVAVLLALGANASPDGGDFTNLSGIQRSEPNSGVLQRLAAVSEPIAAEAIRLCGGSSQSSSRAGETYTVLAAAFQSCSDRALTNALDAFAQVVARLK